MVENSNDWKLGYVLANLKIKEPVESNSGAIALVPFNDRRLTGIQTASNGAKKLLNGFHDMYGKPTCPSAIIYYESAPEGVKSIPAMVDFRNCVAMSYILPGWGQMDFAQISSPSNPLWSDFFDFYPALVDSRDAISSINPAQEIFGGKNAPFEGMSSPYVTQPPGEFIVDTNLLSLLISKWEQRYVSPGTDKWDGRKLFRSLEMAYRVLSLPVKNEGSIHDFGSSIALWVSAFEILAHPEDGKVDKTVVFELLRKAPSWYYEELLDKRFEVQTRKGKLSATLVERLYDDLYNARNAFLHGNTIDVDVWRYKGKTIQIALENLAPVLYRTALMSYLGGPLPTSETDDDIIRAYCDQIYEDFLMQVLDVQ
ncbi:Hypothetical protein DEACI_1514 [Acididesulfobacillus acetoxydans]|uniref:Apea-like HEPN domain-containing protein n=1 Tax=Acididesulfobacillus acetoxydans TaxID=1561005 RepID=A0A8S0WXB6_9FIRM|nr:hypothetical protein [Acididesulfobacillus acetoxydans]CAA7600861.1 Hypothetical protein DEACI_1514 [Acididesulfobacillus acetoxydans]CEJ07210.1 Hypothetical protein DEACI_1668 [Acididesulfobacillus acetoxydans]